MQPADVRKCKCGRYVTDVFLDNGEFYFTTEHFDSRKSAHEWVTNWAHWANNLFSGFVESIYYILQVPDTWAGPAPTAHPYNGLFIKIGRTNNVLKRLSNLQTGTYGDLIIHALEPGGSQRERELHKQFAHLRRHGEWFSCSEELTKHVITTWYKNKMLPPKHQYKLLEMTDRVKAYRQVREIIGGTPDTVNPSLHEDWHGTTFVDLVYSSLAKSGNK